MAYIILSQKKDFKSEYKDELFKLYHFPARYRSTIKTGDVFIYHQGKQGASSSPYNIRYYFGMGIIGEIYSNDGGATYFAELKQCKMFFNNVSIKLEDGNYVEQLGVASDRIRPSWEHSIRVLSEEAYKSIINMSGGLMDLSSDVDTDALKVDLKNSIDRFYLNDDHQALIDIMSLALQLSQKHGVLVK